MCKASFYPFVLNDKLNLRVKPAHLPDAMKGVLNKKVVFSFNLVKSLLKGILSCSVDNAFLKG